MTRIAAGHASVAQANEIGVHFGLAALVRCAWVGSPIGVGAVPSVTPLTLSSRRKASPFWIILWRVRPPPIMELLGPERAIHIWGTMSATGAIRRTYTPGRVLPPVTQPVWKPSLCTRM
jgi:hypothetical protein